MMQTRVLIPSCLMVKVEVKNDSNTRTSPNNEMIKASADSSETDLNSLSSPVSPIDKKNNVKKVVKIKSEEYDHEEEQENDKEAILLKKYSSDCEEEDNGENETDSLTRNSSTFSLKKTKSGGGPLSLIISVFAKTELKQGTKLGPNEGEIQILPGDVHNYLPPLESNDLRLIFGCVDRYVTNSDDHQIRICNWLRFLPPSHDPNIVGRFVQNEEGGQRIEFQVLTDLEEGCRIEAAYDISSLSLFSQHPQLHPYQFTPLPFPLDLSTPTITTPNNNPSSYSRERSTTTTSFSISSVLQLGKVETAGVPSNSNRPILRTRGRERSLLPCEVCGKCFDRPSLLKRHMRTHTGEKPHVCDVCSKGFSTSSSLNTHRRIHSGEKPHQCGVCGKRFTASSNLYYHRMTHNKEKPHKCSCGKSFPTPGDLKSHQYVHSGSWPFNCPICNRGFSKQTNLRNHLLLHSGDKPHSCPQPNCGKKFALACNLRAHLRTHEEEREQREQQQQLLLASANNNNNAISTCVSCKRSYLSSLRMIMEDGQCRPCFLLRQGQGGGSRDGNNINIPMLGPPTASSPHYPPIIPNPFFEQLLLHWNRSGLGQLGFHQKFLMESQQMQMLAAAHHLLTTAAATAPSSPSSISLSPTNLPHTPSGFSVADLLGTGRKSAEEMVSTDDVIKKQSELILRSHPQFKVDLINPNRLK